MVLDSTGLTGKAVEVCQAKLTRSPQIILSSAKFLVCFKFQRALMSLKVCENVILVSNSLDLDEMPSYSSGSKLFAFSIRS